MHKENSDAESTLTSWNFPVIVIVIIIIIIIVTIIIIIAIIIIIRIPSIEVNKSFTYLGKDFNMYMSNNPIKSQLVSTIEQYSKIINRLSIHPLQKIGICQRFIFSKLKWQFPIYNLTETWVAETLDNKFSKFYRRWLQIPISANISQLSLSRNKLGFEIETLKKITKEWNIMNKWI